jgi:hypothetical protein
LKNLSDLILEIFEQANRHPTNAQAKATIEEMVDHNGFSVPVSTPDWFVSLLTHIAGSIPTNGRIKYAPKDGDGDTSNLLAKLEDLIPAKWDDYGEAIEITFDFGVFVYIGRMGRVWEVSLISPT